MHSVHVWSFDAYFWLLSPPYFCVAISGLYLRMTTRSENTSKVLKSMSTVQSVIVFIFYSSSTQRSHLVRRHVRKQNAQDYRLRPGERSVQDHQNVGGGDLRVDAPGSKHILSSSSLPIDRYIGLHIS